MSDHVYKYLELAGSSSVSIEDAVRQCIERASETVHNLRWFEVLETRGHIEEGEVKHWQVSIKVGFTLDAAAELSIVDSPTVIGEKTV